MAHWKGVIVMDGLELRTFADAALEPQAVVVKMLAGLGPRERISLLLSAYRRYRELCHYLGDGSEADRMKHALSVLIMRILAADLSPTQEEAVAILTASHHYCGHGDDVVPPLALAERAYWALPYTDDLFAAVRAYREVLRPFRTMQVQIARTLLAWILWHDVSRPEKKCWTGRIQGSIGEMEAEEAFAWQWLFRNTAPASGGQRRKDWQDQAQRRLTQLRTDRFLERLRQWFLPASGEAFFLSTAGSHNLRLLVWYAEVSASEEAYHLVSRLGGYRWVKPEPPNRAKLELERWNARRASQTACFVDALSPRPVY